MKIIKQDKRLPIAVALAHIMLSGEVSKERKTEIRAEMIRLVQLVSEKFMGFKNVQSMRRSLEVALGILSLGLLNRTSGERNTELLVSVVLDQGLNALAKEATDMVKKLADLPECPSFDWSENYVSARELLVKFATAKEESTGLWDGYKQYCSELASRRYSKHELELAKWLIQRLHGSFSGWCQINNLLAEESASVDWPIPDTVISTLLFRYVNGLPTRGLTRLTIPDLRKVYADYKANRSAWLEKTRKEYEKIRLQIPAEMREALIHRGRDWFDRILADGPPRVTQKTKTVDWETSGNRGLIVSFF